jgi:hypothetical protein
VALFLFCGYRIVAQPGRRGLLPDVVGQKAAVFGDRQQRKSERTARRSSSHRTTLWFTSEWFSDSSTMKRASRARLASSIGSVASKRFAPVTGTTNLPFATPIRTASRASLKAVPSGRP